MALADTARLVAQLVLDDKGFSRGIDRAIAKAGTLEKTLGNVGKRSAAGLSTAAHNATRAVEGLGAAGVVAIGASVKVAADFESQLNTINTVAQLTDDQLAGVGDSLRKVARDTGTDLSDLTTGFYDLVSAGVQSADALDVLTAANTLAVGGLATTAETIDLLTTAINAYGGDASRAAEFSDKFAQSIAAGKVTAAELAESFATIGPIAAASGIEIDELAAGYAQLTAQGVPAAEASTQMRSALVGLLSPNAKLNKIQKETGKNFAAIAKEKGLVVALEDLRKEADRAGVPLIDLIGRVEGFNFALATTGDNLAGYNRNLQDVADSSGVAADQMSERQQGLNYQLARLKALAKDAGITVGSALLPKLTPLAEKAVAFLETHEPDIQRFADNIASGFDKALAFAERIPWGAIGSGLESAATWAGRLLDVFLGFPPEVQTLIISLAALNKLSGGAIAGVAGELAKGAIKGVLGINAATVNLRAATVVAAGGAGGGITPTPGTGGPQSGGVRGAIGKVASAATKVFLVGAAVGVFSELLGVLDDQEQANKAQTQAIEEQGKAFRETASVKDLKTSLSNLEKYQYDLTYGSQALTPQGIAYALNIDGVRTTVEGQISGLKSEIAKQEQANRSGFTAAQQASASRQNIANERLEAIREQNVKSAVALGAGIKDTATETAAVRTAAVGLIRDTNSELAGVREASALAASRIGDTRSEIQSAKIAAAQQALASQTRTAAGLADVRGAIQRKDLSVDVTTFNTFSASISVRETIKTQTTFKQYNRFIS